MTAGDLDSILLGRIVRPADYARVLATPMRLRSPHFAVHHLDGRPLPLKRPIARPAPATGSDDAPVQGSQQGHAPATSSLSTELSTDLVIVPASGVEDSVETPGARHWFGLVVPKRHAKRAVTRTLVKRQIRNIVSACSAELEPGLWVVRQRYPFDVKQYPSAASDALKEAARTELRALFERAVRGERDRFKPRPPGWTPDRGGRKKGQKPGGAACAA